MWERYEQDTAKARERVRAVPSKQLVTKFGVVEYAVSGSGQPVLMSHGILGSHVEGLGMVRSYFGEDAFAIAPSRFGYFGSELPAGATPALQADVYASLLDALGVERAVIIGFSAGGPSAIEFGLRHAERVELLVLASSALPREPIPFLARKLGPPFMRAALSTDRIFWLFRELMPKTFRRLLGAPTVELSTEELTVLEEIGASVFPLGPRRAGAVFDAFMGNPYVNGCALESITAPALIIHAVDDSLAPFAMARRAAARMPAARFVTIERGGHEFLGHEADVRRAITESLNRHRNQREEPWVRKELQRRPHL